MQESLKIKVFVSPLVRSQLEMDVQDYKLRGLGELCNRIIARFPELEPMRKGESSEELYKNCPPLQFYVRKENADFLRFAQERNFKKGTLCRHYFEEYVNLSRGDRECFLQRDLLQKVNAAIEAKENLFIGYRDAVLHVAPCFVAFSPSRVRAYLVVCEEANRVSEAFRALRISHMKSVVADPKSAAFHLSSFALSKQAELFREHFDPFLCYGKEVLVRLNETGIDLLRRAVTNRPPFERVKGLDGVYRFQCSEKLAQIYFPQFLENAEILSPQSLREWFLTRFQKAMVLYRKA